MSDADRLLELIEESIVEHGGDLGGWTRRSEGALQLFDGRVTLRAQVHESEPGSEGLVHAHAFATLHEHDDEVLDACLFGIGDDRASGLAQASMVFMMCVAGPIKSFIDNQPVCMTCQAGVAGGDVEAGFSPEDYGLTGMRAYVGPAVSRGLEDGLPGGLDGGKPWFRYAAESAAPRRVHMAKATIIGEGENGWRREMEIDGHDVSHVDHDWPAGVPAPKFGYTTRFAVFEFPRNSVELRRRAELERAIRHFAEHMGKWDSVDDLMRDMVEQGFDADVVHEVESISTIAFSRSLFEPHGVKFSPTIIRARRDGRVETDVPLMSIPAFNRGRALIEQLRDTLSDHDLLTLCGYNAEGQVLLGMIEEHGEGILHANTQLYPCVVPDRGVSDETFNQAMATLDALAKKKHATEDPKLKMEKRPWWKFW